MKNSFQIHSYYRKDLRYGIKTFNRVRRLHMYRHPEARVYMIDFRGVFLYEQPKELLHPPYVRAWFSRCRAYFMSIENLKKYLKAYFSKLGKEKGSLESLANYLGITVNTLKGWASGYYDDETILLPEKNYSDYLRAAIKRVTRSYD